MLNGLSSKLNWLAPQQKLRPGDYVVHAKYGIAKYLGLVTKPQCHTGSIRDYLVLEYRHGVKFYIPATQIGLIQRYASATVYKPRLSELHTSVWKQEKQNAYHKAQSEAQYLLSIYAKRRTLAGHQFPKDGPWQASFDSQFKYPLTTGQKRSVQEIKHDMESPRPMSRLLVGDVGYGKTEVALRAAFKAILGGRQVAFLVPTTILAIQHCTTILKRFRNFPVRIGIMSGINNQAQTKQTLKGLASGRIDIVVGTQRLLSKDVRFQHLGLLIIDEEQRFGVQAKNHFKHLYPWLDVLTLTATPIPRTLNLAILGIQGLSIIETPPVNRKPINTYVAPETKLLIKQGVKRELQRNGQVFFLHNRVADMAKAAHRLKQLVPSARIAYIDGQMDDRTIERTLLAFINRKYDILVATTIIETGIDINNANTLFIENAGSIGLAQLYQLRGRVGRSSRQAYAYLMYSNHRPLTELGSRRLHVMKKYNQLGAGFHIAMRDLNLRGSGTLLGKKQHGFINTVGYHLYLTLLRKAIRHQQHEEQPASTNNQVNTIFPCYLPKQLSDNKKLAIYQQLGRSKEQASLKLPARLYNLGASPFHNLLYTVRIKGVIEGTDLNEVDIYTHRLTFITKVPYQKRHSLLSKLPQGLNPTIKPIAKHTAFDIDVKPASAIQSQWFQIIKTITNCLKG